ncbi:Fic family protein [Bengtsoniella intestinalis]|uniref:Fic family protein n=1 Tax=Bengtsoniella intestinalis TaxID=3073143 RepID=UPI00391FA90C
MTYIKVSQAAQKWGITPRRVRILCAEGKIEGVTRQGKLYMIPETAPKPADGRRRAVSFLKQPYGSLLQSIDAKKEQLDSRRPLTQGELLRLRDDFLIDFTYNSNAIEGNTLTLQETALVLEGITIDRKPLKDHLEAVGHRDAYLYMEDLAKGHGDLTPMEIKSIHALVLMHRPEDKGVYRKIPVSILGAFVQPVEPFLIAEKMDDLLAMEQQRKNTLHVIERIARFHLEFEGIHPFIDGNGRCGRLLMNFALIRNGYPPVNIKFTHRKRYYDAFDAYYRDGDAGAMVTMLAEYVNQRLDGYLQMLD